MSILHGPPGGPERQVSLSPAPPGNEGSRWKPHACPCPGDSGKAGMGWAACLGPAHLPGVRLQGPRYATPLTLYVIWRDPAPSIAGLEQGCQPSAPRSWEGVPDSHPGREPAMIGSMAQEGVTRGGDTALPLGQDLPLPAPGRDKMSEGRDADAGCTLGEGQGLQAPGSGVGQAGQGPWAGVCPQGEVCQCPHLRDGSE